MKISIIIPTYNHLDDCLRPCLQSLINHTTLETSSRMVEIIVVANGCNDGTQGYVQSLPGFGKHIKLIEKPNALGYPRSVNLGLCSTQADYYVLLNNDAAIQDGWPDDYWLNILLETFLKHPKAGIVGILPHYEPRVQVDFFIFCEVMISHQCFEAVGYLDESLSPGSGEDVDYCVRARQAGFECVEPDLGIKSYWNSNRYISNYPLYHAASRTVQELPGWQSIFDANMGKLRKRYDTDSRVLDPQKISVIIPTYNHLEDCLKPCCESIARNSSNNVEVIVVANGCTDGTRDYVQSLDRRFKLTEFPEAMGYPCAINAGLRIARGDYIVLLNNDTIILDWAGKDGWLKILQAPFINDPRVGLTGPSLQRNHEIDEDFLIFFCVMLSRKVLDDLGPLDEAFSPGAGEDTAYCVEARKKGYKVLEVPDKTSEQPNQIVGHFPIWHKAEATVNDLPEWKELFKRNGKMLLERYGKKRIPEKEKTLNLANWDGHNTERAVISRTGEIPPREFARYSWARKNLFGNKILEIGCSSGYALRFLKDVEGLDYTGIDYDVNIIKYAKENFGDIPGVTFIQSDINSFSIKQYDTIIAFEVIEHLPNGRELVQRLKHHCKKLLISVPYKEIPGLWGPYHKLHGLEERDFPDFNYFYVMPDGRLQKERLDHQGHGLMLMEWTAEDYEKKGWEPKVAVITPLYNDESHILKAIESVRSQTYSNYRHFIYDDGSTDGSVEYITNGNFADITLIRGTNQGQGHARNKLISEALKYGFDCIAFLDSDDVWNPEHLDVSVSLMDQNIVDVVYGKPLCIDESGNSIAFYGFGRPTKFIGRQLESSNYIWISGVMARAVCFKNNEFDNSLNSLEDWDMWYRLYKQGYQFLYTGKQTFTYLVRDQGQAAKGQAKRPLVVAKHGLKLQGTRLNIACGEDYREDYINADFSSVNNGMQARCDTFFDVRSIPYEDGTVDEIRALHILEHFDFPNTNAVLKEWYRVLKNGGKLILETPDFLRTCEAFVKGNDSFRVLLYGHFFAFPWLPGQVHKFLFTEDQLRVQLGWAGFKEMKRIDPISNYIHPTTRHLFLTVETYK